MQTKKSKRRQIAYTMPDFFARFAIINVASKAEGVAVVFLDNYWIGAFGTIDNVVHRVKCALEHEPLPPLEFTPA